MEEYEQNANTRRVVYISLIASLAIIIPLIFYIVTSNEARSFNNSYYGSYDNRMNDSALFTFIMFGLLLIFVVPLIVMINSMFKRYAAFIKTLTPNDIEKLIILNEKENFLYKYMPAYILRKDTVTFFTVFRQTTISFNDMTSINVRQVFFKGYKAFITIRTMHDKYHFTLSGSHAKVIDLVVEGKTINPRIINNENWNY